MPEISTIETLLKRDRLFVLGGLLMISALAWSYIGYLAWTMEPMDMAMHMAMPHMQTWGLIDIGLLFLMWTSMMMAMMLPSATPMILMFATINRRRRERQHPLVPTIIFLAGYLLVWTGFSLVATLAQWGLHTAALLSATMVSTSPILGGLLLVAAGAFEWTPVKSTCLAHCRSPLGFLTTEWREGTRGAFRMGLKHGSYCTGCCWVLMALLFVAGVMNLVWVAVITIFILVEKLAPRGEIIGRLAGGVLFLSGLILLGQTWW